MPIAGLRRKFAPSFLSPYQEDITDPDLFIIYTKDLGATVLYDYVDGFSTDGTYYIRYDFTGGAVVDSDNAGMWMEYRYVRASSGASRTIHSRQQWSPFQSASDWALESPNGGNSATEVYLSAAMSVTFYMSDLFDNIGPDDTEDKVPGTWSVKRTITGPVNNSSDILVCEFEMRMLAVKNFRADKPRFDPCSDENKTYFKFDVLALPVGWTPAEGEVGISLDVQAPGIPGLNDSYSLEEVATVTSPDSNGKIAEVSIPWDGIRMYYGTASGEPLEGLFDGWVTAGTGPAEDSNARSYEKFAKVQLLRCACRCSKSHITGMTFMSFPLGDLIDTPVGPPIQLELAYCTSCYDALPSSHGFGWRSNGSTRIFEDSVGGAIAYRNESGNYVRWILDGTDYVAQTSDNFATLTKDSDPDATYVITFKDQARRVFDEDGLLKQDLDRNGNALTYTYSGGHLDTMTDAVGNVVTFDYTGRSDGQPVGVTSGVRSIAYTYDVNDRLESVTNAAGETTSFVYNAAGLLWKVIDTRNEEAMVYLYDDLGRVVSESSYGLQTTLTTYWESPANGLSVSVIDESSEPAPDSVTEMVFNGLGNLVSKSEMVAAQGEEDAIFNTTQFEYNDANFPRQVTKIINPNLSVTIMTYNAEGDLASVEDDHGNLWVYSYTQDVDTPPLNPMHRGLIREIHAPSVTQNPDSGEGQTKFEYDEWGNVVVIEDPYYNQTRLSRRSDGLVEEITDRRDFTTVLTYRLGDNRLETITTPAGPDFAPSRTTTLDYDDFGNVISAKDPLNNEVVQEFDEVDRLISVTDARGKTVTMNYVDGLLDNLVAPANAGSSSNPRTSQFTYDLAGRLTQVDAEIATSTFQKRVGYAYTGFSQLRELSRLQDSVNKATSYQYDPLGRMTEANDFLDRTTQVAHAPFCLENTVTTARGIRRKSSFDSLCRLVQMETQDSGEDALMERQLNEYDELGRLLKASKGAIYAWTDEEEESTRKGGRFGESNFASVTTYVYDRLNQVTEFTHNGATTAYEYDQEGNVRFVTAPSGRVTEYNYYNDGRLRQVIFNNDTEDSKLFQYEYDEAGRLASIIYPGNVMVASFTKENDSSGWNENGQLECLRYLMGGQHFHRFEYSYDDSGNRIQLIDTSLANGWVTWDYGYDWLNRLVSVTRDSTLVAAYFYDESDNRIRVEMPQANENWDSTYDLADQILTRSLDVYPPTLVEEFDHDEDGNMIARTLDSVTTHYDWDHNNRLKKIRKDGEADQKYQYDAGGIRDKHINDDDGAKAKFYSSGGMSLCDTRPNGPVSFVQGHQLLGLEQDTNMFYFLTDGLGSVRLILDETGTVVGEFKHDEFGRQELSTADPELSAHSYVGALGVRNDFDVSGLLYMRQRYYDPQLGRFLSQDSIGFAGSLNLFGYAGQNPVNRVDPSGLLSGFTEEQGNVFSDALGILSRAGGKYASMAKRFQALARNGKIDIIDKNDKGMGTCYGYAPPFNSEGTGANKPGIHLDPSSFGVTSVAAASGIGGDPSSTRYVRAAFLASVLVHESSHYYNRQWRCEKSEKHNKVYLEQIQFLQDLAKAEGPTWRGIEALGVGIEVERLGRANGFLKGVPTITPSGDQRPSWLHGKLD